MASPIRSLVKASQGAVVRPLGALAAGLTRIQDRLYQAPEEVIPGMKPTDWPSPLQPVRPFGEPDAQPLGFNMWMGQNLIYTPRPDSRYSAADLQALARYPLARICITNVIDTITSLPWKIQLRSQPGEEHKVPESKQLKDDTILELTEFVNNPNADEDFTEFSRKVLNDMLTIDAGCVLLRRGPGMSGKGARIGKAQDAFGNVVYEWRAMQGAYITRLVDANGYIPQPPAPAYQQLWEGIPRVNLSTDQLVYRPRNIVYDVANPWTALYGFSSTEQLAPEIEVGIQRLRYVTAFYKDGAIPNVLWVVPANTSADTVSDAQKILNMDMAGNLESRRQFRFAQGFKPADSPKDELIKQFEEPKLSDEYDDLHTRRICFGYGTSAQRLLRMMTRATAQSNQEAAEEEGIAPYRKWYEDFVNYMLQRKMGYEKYEFRYDISQDPDPVKQAEIDKAILDAGTETINERRVARGKDPAPEPEADQLGKWIATGWVPIGQLPAPPDANKPDGDGSSSAQPKPEDDGEGEDDGENEPTPKGTPKKKVAKAQAEPLAILNPARDTIRARTARAALFTQLVKFFDAIRSNIVIVTPTRKAAKAKLRKDDEEKRIDEIVDKIMDSIGWKSLPSAVQPGIAEASSDGATTGMDEAQRAYQAEPGIVRLSPAPVRVIVSSVISEVNQVAADYAHDRAAELVGMKWVDGELVQNPNAAMAITDSTRNMLREIIAEAFEHEAPLTELVERIKQAGVFSEDRAKLIADTEVKFAQSRGNLAAWQKVGVVEKIRWITSSLHTEDDECDDNAQAGPVAVGTNFPSGVPAPPAHPRCRCTAAIAQLKDPKKSD